MKLATKLFLIVATSFCILPAFASKTITYKLYNHIQNSAATLIFDKAWQGGGNVEKGPCENEGYAFSVSAGGYTEFKVKNCSYAGAGYKIFLGSTYIGYLSINAVTSPRKDFYTVATYTNNKAYQTDFGSSTVGSIQ